MVLLLNFNFSYNFKIYYVKFQHNFNQTLALFLNTILDEAYYEPCQISNPAILTKCKLSLLSTLTNEIIRLSSIHFVVPTPVSDLIQPV